MGLCISPQPWPGLCADTHCTQCAWALNRHQLQNLQHTRKRAASELCWGRRGCPETVFVPFIQKGPSGTLPFMYKVAILNHHLIHALLHLTDEITCVLAFQISSFFYRSSKHLQNTVYLCVCPGACLIHKIFMIIKVYNIPWLQK